MDYRMPRSGPMADFYSRWTEWLVQGLELDYLTVRGSYLYRANAFFSATLPKHTLEQVSQLGTADLRKLIERYDVDPAKERAVWTALKRFYEFAVLEGLQVSSPVTPRSRPLSALEQFYDRWMLALYKRGISPSVQRAHRRLASRFLRQSGLPAEPVSFGAISPDHFLRYYQANVLGGRSCRNVFRSFELMLDAAVDQGYAKTNVLTGYWHLFETATDTPTIEPTAPKIISPEEIEDLERRLHLIPGDEWIRSQDLALVPLFYRHRMRPAEAFSLRDHPDGTFSISVRGRARQTIDLDAECVARIRTLLAILPHPRATGEPLFWGQTGMPLDHNWLGHRWRTIPVAGGTLTAGLLRNSSLAHAMAAGVPVDEIQAASRMKHGITLADGVDIDLIAFFDKYARLHPRYDHQ